MKPAFLHICPFGLMKNCPLHSPTSLPFCCQHSRWCLLCMRESMSLIQRGSGVWKPCQAEVTTTVLPASSLLHLSSELTTQFNRSSPEACTGGPIFEMPIFLPSLAEHDHELNNKICGKEEWRMEKIRKLRDAKTDRSRHESYLILVSLQG